MTWITGSSETVSAEWRDPDDDSPYDLEITAVGITYTYNDGVDDYYLQSDGVTFATTPYSFTATKVGTRWEHSLTIDSAWRGINLCWTATPTPFDFGVQGGIHFVQVPSSAGLGNLDIKYTRC